MGLVTYSRKYSMANNRMVWCRQRLAPYKVPQYMGFRDMLPKSKVRKVLRRKLRERSERN